MLIGVDASRAFTPDKTGTENYSRELIEALLALPEAKKHTWRLFTQDTSKVEFSRHLGGGVEIRMINWPRLWTQAGLALELWRRPIDVLWIPAHTLPVFRPRKIKTVVTIHGLEYEYLPQYYQFPQRLWLNRSTVYAVKQADRLIAVSQWTKKQLVERLAAKPGKIAVVHEGVSQRFVNRQLKSEYLRQIRYKYGLPKNYILFVGTIQPRKNLVRLIEAIKGINLPLIIAGKKGWLYEEILAAPKKFKVADRVKFIGRVGDADLPAVYKMAKIFVYPSLMEGFGLPVLEAFASGVPVITSDQGALPEVAGKAALLVHPEKTEELTQALNLIWENEELQQGLIEKGYRQVKKFSWERAAKQTLAVLTEKW